MNTNWIQRILNRLGLPAGASLAADIATIDTVVDAIKAITDALPDAGALTTVQADLDNPDQYKADLTGLAQEATLTAIGALIDAIKLVTDALPEGGALTVIDGLLDDIKAKTDNLKDAWNDITAAAVKTAIEVAGSHLALIKAQTDKIAGKMLFSMDFWSDPQEEVVVTNAQTTPGLPSVTVRDLPGTATIVRAIAMFKFRMVENINAAENSLNCDAAQPIQVQEPVNGHAYTDAINFVDEMFKITAETREGGDVLIGSIDIGTKVVANEAYSFQWLNARAHLANLQFNDVQTGLRIWYSV